MSRTQRRDVGRPRRIALVVPSFGLGGAERVMLLLAHGLAAEGHDVALIVLDGRGPLHPGAAAPFDVIDLRTRRALAALPALVRAVRAAEPTVVMASQTHLNTLLALVRRWLGREVRLVAREPALWDDGAPERRSVRALRRLALRRSDLVIASSSVMQSQLEVQLGRSVHVLPNPVDVEGLRARAAAPARRNGDGLRLVCVARLAEGKGHDDLLDAFAAAAGPADRLTLIGDGPLLPLLAERVEQPDLHGRVDLMGGLSDPIPLVAGADALVLASVSEGMPNVVLEALAVGTPVLVTDELVTLGPLAASTPDGAVRMVGRAGLAQAVATTAVLGPGPRPAMLPPAFAVERVVRRLVDALEGDLGPAPPGRPRRTRAHILMPILAPFPSTFVSSVQSANMAQAFAELGHAVVLAASHPDPTFRDGDGREGLAPAIGFEPSFAHRVLAGRVRRGQSFWNALRIAALARRLGPDLVYARDLRGCVLPARRGVSTVLEAHSMATFTRRLDRWALRSLLRAPGFLGIVAISSALAEDLVAAFDVPPDAILVAHDAVRTSVDGGSSTYPSRSPGDLLRVGYVGSLFAGRGVDVLLEVARRAPWLQLHLVGGPPDVAAGLADELARGSIDATVHGQVSPVRARAMQREMDVLVAPFARRVGTDSGVDTSRWMSPMKVFEYMASGRPIIISDLPVLHEVLRPGVDALMVPPEDPGALLAALERLRDDPELGRRLASSALERARGEFTWELRARRILERFGA